MTRSRPAWCPVCTVRCRPDNGRVPPHLATRQTLLYEIPSRTGHPTLITRTDTEECPGSNGKPSYRRPRPFGPAYPSSMI